VLNSSAQQIAVQQQQLQSRPDWPMAAAGSEQATSDLCSGKHWNWISDTHRLYKKSQAANHVAAGSALSTI